MFVDQAVIEVAAGKGGDGHVSFHRGSGAPKGGPDGGDGGRGGDVIFEADSGLNTLLDFRDHRKWAAPEGGPGEKRQCHGADAKDLVIRIPPGTIAINKETGDVLAELTEPGERVIIAKGGRGGFGNEHFKSPIHQAPRHATPGEPGQRFTIQLELKLIAEVGFVGLPNAGKSTLLKSLTRADPKIGAYPFTTLSPQLGIAQLDPARRLVLADIPGLIEGASRGAGLGHDFLRHVERTRVIVHLLDCAPPDGTSPAHNYRTIRAELGAYSTELAEKPELIALSKTDLLGDDDLIAEAVAELRRELRLGAGTEVIPISSGASTGLDRLLEALWVMVHGPAPVHEGWAAPRPGSAT